jgi:hypothetical protein
MQTRATGASARDAARTAEPHAAREIAVRATLQIVAIHEPELALAAAASDIDFTRRWQVLAHERADRVVRGVQVAGAQLVLDASVVDDRLGLAADALGRLQQGHRPVAALAEEGGHVDARGAAADDGDPVLLAQSRPRLDLVVRERHGNVGKGRHARPEGKTYESPRGTPKLRQSSCAYALVFARWPLDCYNCKVPPYTARQA